MIHCRSCIYQIPELELKPLIFCSTPDCSAVPCRARCGPPSHGPGNERAHYCAFPSPWRYAVLPAEWSAPSSVQWWDPRARAKQPAGNQKGTPRPETAAARILQFIIWAICAINNRSELPEKQHQGSSLWRSFGTLNLIKKNATARKQRTIQ